MSDDSVPEMQHLDQSGNQEAGQRVPSFDSSLSESEAEVTMTSKVGDTYECAECHGLFERSITDAEAMEEYQQSPLFIPGDEDLALICDDCYHRIERKVKEHEDALRRRNQSGSPW